jgi:hypothetical protein
MNILFTEQRQYKVLTLWQPWATLLVHGIKKIETRPKATNWTIEKGSYLIHAASKWDKWQQKLCLDEPFYSELRKVWHYWYNCSIDELKYPNLPIGQIIGSIDITECQQIIYNNSDDFKTIYAKLQDGTIINDPEESFGDYTPGRYAWLTQNPRILKTPIPYKNGQGYYQNFKGDVNQLIFI